MERPELSSLSFSVRHRPVWASSLQLSASLSLPPSLPSPLLSTLVSHSCCNSAYSVLHIAFCGGSVSVSTAALSLLKKNMLAKQTTVFSKFSQLVKECFQQALYRRSRQQGLVGNEVTGQRDALISPVKFSLCISQKRLNLFRTE